MNPLHMTANANLRILWSGPFLDGTLTCTLDAATPGKLYYILKSHDISAQGTVQLIPEFEAAPELCIPVMLDIIKGQYHNAVLTGKAKAIASREIREH